MKSRRVPEVASAAGVLLAGVALSLTMALPVRAAATEETPEVVARVSGRPILRRDFDLAVQLRFAGRRTGRVGLAELRAVKLQVLERLIDAELIHQEAGRSSIRVKDTEVDAEVARVRGPFPDEAAFTAFLDEQGVTPAEFREQMRRSLLVARFVEREVVGNSEVSDKDVRLHYEQNPAEMTRPEALRLSQIMERVPARASTAERAAARQKMEAVFKELRNGADFAELARKHSQGPEADRGGDTGWVSRGSLPPPIERAAFALQEGSHSDIVETRLGLHILKVTERRPEGPIPFDEARASIRTGIIERRRDEALRSHVEALRQKATIERLLKLDPQEGK